MVGRFAFSSPIDCHLDVVGRFAFSSPMDRHLDVVGRFAFSMTLRAMSLLVSTHFHQGSKGSKVEEKMDKINRILTR